MPLTTNPPGIDRVAPTLRPSGRPVMRQDWSHLLFLHWEVPVSALRPIVPQSLEIDTFEGRAFVGLVPFAMSGVRPLWSPAVPGLSRFLEVNVRTYVHFEGRDPGVWFFSLDAANRIAVNLARTFWNLPYFYAKMRMDRPSGGPIRYRSTRVDRTAEPPGCSIAYRPDGTPSASVPKTLEHFLAERYILYTSGRRALLSGRVHHSAYPLQPARLESLEESLIGASGIERPATDPLAHYAWGVRVLVYPLRPVV